MLPHSRQFTMFYEESKTVYHIKLSEVSPLFKDQMTRSKLIQIGNSGSKDFKYYKQDDKLLWSENLDLKVSWTYAVMLRS